jgi:hypothetical protein
VSLSLSITSHAPSKGFRFYFFKQPSKVCIALAYLLLRSNKHSRLLLYNQFQAFSKDAQVLKGGADLPNVLWELLGLVSEAPSGWDVEVDKSILKSIEDMDN